MIKSLTGISLIDLLPDNLLADEQIHAAAKALDGELQKTSGDCKEVIHLARLDELPEKVLDLLAWQWHVDFYEPIGLDVQTKRNLIRQSIEQHRRKGTPWAVEKGLNIVFNKKAAVHEWNNYDGEPYHFRVEVGTKKPANNDDIKMAYSSIRHSKNVRSVLDSLNVVIEPDSGETEIIPAEDGYEEISVNRKYIAIGSAIRKIVTINPEVRFEAPHGISDIYISGAVAVRRRIEPSVMQVYHRRRRVLAMSVVRRINMNMGGAV